MRAAPTHPREDLEAAVRDGHFRGDLLVRLSVSEIQVPPLRERRDDILPLAAAFMGEFSPATRRFSFEVEQALLAYPWPGNVRELRAAIQHALVLGEGTSLELSALPARMAAAQTTYPGSTSSP